MTIASRSIGVMNIQWEGEEREFVENELFLVATEYIALVLANLQLRDELTHQATRDPLTNLYNRRYMEEAMNREFFRCSRKGYPISILFIDIDNFKEINDRYGHEAGDFVLKTMANRIVQGIRREDIACRIGGEEFVVILPETTIEAAASRAENLCQKLNLTGLTYGGEALGEITVSIGVSTWPDHGSDPQVCLSSADAALYCAKGKGKNRVEVASFPDSGYVTESSALEG